MRIAAILVTAIMFAATGRAETPPSYSEILAGHIISQPKSNLCLVVLRTAIHHSESFPSDSRIYFGFISTNGARYKVCNLKPEYGIRLSATNESGKIAEKTSKGKSFGERFDLVKGYDRKIIPKADGTKLQYISIVTSGFPETGRSLPPLNELFRFDPSTKYKVFLELQVIAWPFNGSPSKDSFVVKFDPIMITVDAN
jgi:hypothetical protein